MGSVPFVEDLPVHTVPYFRYLWYITGTFVLRYSEPLYLHMLELGLFTASTTLPAGSDPAELARPSR